MIRTGDIDPCPEWTLSWPVKQQMKTKIYIDNYKIITGITLKDEGKPEYNNMALHACLRADDVVRNRRKLADALHCGPEDFVCCNQTHSSNFYKVSRADKGRGAYSLSTAIKDTDALYTYEPNLLLCCFTADCVPVTFYHETTDLVGVIHSGWQGTVKEITRKVFKHLTEFEHCDPREFHVYIGPAISRECFEVDEPVYVKFKELGYGKDFMSYNDETGKYHIDNQQFVKLQCEMSGIQGARIKTDNTCTYKSADGFSYRQDKKCGRHMSFIMKKGL